MEPGDAPGTPTRAEPRWLTPGDLAAIVAGVALTMALRRDGGMLPPIVGSPRQMLVFVVLIWCERCFEAAMVSLALAVLVRQAGSGRMPRPGEWLAILFAATFALDAVPNLDSTLNEVVPHAPLAADFGRYRWLAAGLGLAVALALLGLLAALRRLLPAWARTVVLGTVAALLLWGPLETLWLQGSDLSPDLQALRPRRLFWVAVAARKLASQLPIGLLFGIPAVAAFRGWRRGEARNWAWTDRAALGLAAVEGGFLLVDLYLLRSEIPRAGLDAERIVTPFGIAAVWALSGLVVRRLGPTWRGVVGDDPRIGGRPHATVQPEAPAH